MVARVRGSWRICNALPTLTLDSGYHVADCVDIELKNMAQEGGLERKHVRPTSIVHVDANDPDMTFASCPSHSSVSRSSFSTTLSGAVLEAGARAPRPWPC